MEVLAIIIALKSKSESYSRKYEVCRVGWCSFPRYIFRIVCRFCTVKRLTVNDLNDVQLMFDLKFYLTIRVVSTRKARSTYFERDSPSDFNVPFFFLSVITYYPPVK